MIELGTKFPCKSSFRPLFVLTGVKVLLSRYFKVSYKLRISDYSLTITFMNTVLNNFYIDTFHDNKLVKTNKILIIGDTMRLRDKFRK